MRTAPTKSRQIQQQQRSRPRGQQMDNNDFKYNRGRTARRISTAGRTSFTFLSTSNSPDEQQQEDSSSSPSTATSDSDVSSEESVACPDCDLCDGSGRIAGGIGAVVPWIPIKAYRPCSNFLNRGGEYKRSGQGLDEIAFGRDTTFNKNQ